MTPIRFRTDSTGNAEDAARLARGETVPECSCQEPDCPNTLERIRATPPAEPGDTWRLFFHHEGEGDGPVAGYGICCPGCRQVHYWSSASNCEPKVQRTGRNPDGSEFSYWTCEHRERRESCWTWTGSAEEGTLSAYASLYAKGACGWHGWLRNGELVLA